MRQPCLASLVLSGSSNTVLSVYANVVCPSSAQSQKCFFASSLFFYHSVDTVEAAFAKVPEEFKATFGVTKPALDAPELVFHCQMGRRGGVATSKAYELGYVK